MRRLLVAVAAGLVLTPTAAAHVSVLPSLLPSGREVVLRIELPGLRPGFEPTGLDVTGDGISTLTTAQSGRIGEESRWRVRVDVATPPGPLELLLVARYADGRSITVRQTVTVVPPAEAVASGSSGHTLLWAAGAGAAVLLGVGALVGLRRRAAARERNGAG